MNKRQLPDPPAATDAAPRAQRSICPWCQKTHSEPPGTSVMCLRCGEWMVTESVPE